MRRTCRALGVFGLLFAVFSSRSAAGAGGSEAGVGPVPAVAGGAKPEWLALSEQAQVARSEEHTSELQSRENLVCRLLLEKKKKNIFATETSKKKINATDI